MVRTLNPSLLFYWASDDITQPDEEQKVHSFGTLNLECVSITNKLDLEEQSQGALSTAECGLVEDVVEEERQGAEVLLYFIS